MEELVSRRLMVFSVHMHLVFFSLALSIISCGQSEPAQLKALETSYGYDFASPDEDVKLPGRLKEISALTMVDDSLLAAVQDEDGKVFLIEPSTGRVVDEFKFAKDGDYEGIELVDDTLYVLRSDGDIFVISDWRSESRTTRKIETYLDTKNDTEGLGYQPSHHRLLVVAKEFPGRGRKRVRSIYGFDLPTKKLDPEPVYTVHLDSVDAFVGLPGQKIRDFLAPVLDIEAFKPAALAVHPRTNEIFIVSSVLKVIAVLSASGELITLLPLLSDDLKQPEGIAFLPNGDLFISTEGVGGRGRILRFNEH